MRSTRLGVVSAVRIISDILADGPLSVPAFMSQFVETESDKLYPVILDYDEETGRAICLRVNLE